MLYKTIVKSRVVFIWEICISYYVLILLKVYYEDLIGGWSVPKNYYSLFYYTIILYILGSIQMNINLENPSNLKLPHFPSSPRPHHIVLLNTKHFEIVNSIYLCWVQCFIVIEKHSFSNMQGRRMTSCKNPTRQHTVYMFILICDPHMHTLFMELKWVNHWIIYTFFIIILLRNQGVEAYCNEKHQKHQQFSFSYFCVLKRSQEENNPKYV